MRCPKCKSDYTALICPACAAEKSRAAYLNYQALFLPRVINDGLKVQLSSAGPKQSHIVLFGEANTAYCGMDLKHHHGRDWKRYSDLQRAKLCPECLTVFDRLANESATAKTA